MAIPDTPAARDAVDLGRREMPLFLFNHCMRTYVFGALLAQKERVAFDPELMFVGAALHDLGLVKSHQTRGQPFEMDSADATAALLRRNGVDAARREQAWRAVAMHASPLLAHEAPALSIVGQGAGCDVLGGGLSTLSKSDVSDVLSAFPRLGFGQAFEALLLDYCRGKPGPQSSGWTDGFCRSHAPDAHYPDLDAAIKASPFKD